MKPVLENTKPNIVDEYGSSKRFVNNYSSTRT